MAMSRKSLKAMGLTDEQIDSIIEMHTETVDSYKDKLKAAQEKAEKLDDVQKQLDTLKANNADDYKTKYENAKKALDDYKAEQANKEARATKEKAVRAYLESKKISGGNLDIAMMAISNQIDGYELDGDKLKSTDALDNLVSGKLASLVVSTSTTGAQTGTPPANTKTETAKPSRAAQLAAQYSANLYGTVNNNQKGD